MAFFVNYHAMIRNIRIQFIHTAIPLFNFIIIHYTTLNQHKITSLIPRYTDKLLRIWRGFSYEYSSQIVKHTHICRSFILEKSNMDISLKNTPPTTRRALLSVCLDTLLFMVTLCPHLVGDLGEFILGMS